MRKGRNVIGKDLLSYTDGLKISTVKDLVIGDKSDELWALLVEEGGLLSTPRVVTLDHVTSFGRDAVIIDGSRSVMAADHYPAVANILSKNDKLTGKKVFTEDGTEEGSISDVYFDERSGRVLGFEVSGGLIQNVQKGTSYLPLEAIVNIGPDIVLIRPEAGEALDAQVGGVQGALQGAGEKIGNVTEQTVVGKRAGTDVEADDGSIIVACGQRITSEHVEMARSRGKMPQLLAAAGIGGVQQPQGTVGGAAGQAKAQADQSAGTLWEQFRQKMAGLTNSAGQRVDEEQTKQRLARIEDAVGRPVTKVILDRQDKVILNLGDIITHEAVQRAYDAGMLDSLLSSAYKGEVVFDKEEMRVQQEAQATVDKSSGNAPVLDEMQQKIDQAQERRDAERVQREAQAAQAQPIGPGSIPGGEATRITPAPAPQTPQRPAASPAPMRPLTGDAPQAGQMRPPTGSPDADLPQGGQSQSPGTRDRP